MDWPAWVEALSALITAVFTGLLFVATYRLWNSTKGLYDETKRLAEDTINQTDLIKDSLAISRAAANEAAAANKLTREVFLAENRPWIGIQGIMPAGDLIRVADGSFTTNIHFTVRNSGGSPAMAAWAIMTSHVIGRIGGGGKVAQDAACAEAKRVSEEDPAMSFAGSLIIPNDPGVVSGILTIRAKSIEQAIERRGSVIATGCITYKSPVGNDWHQSRFMFFLGQFDAAKPTGLWPIDFNQTIIPVNQLTVQTYFAGFMAD